MYSAVYHHDELLSHSSIKQYYWTVLLKPKLPTFFMVLACFVVISFIHFPYRDWVAVAMVALVIALVAAWVKSYFVAQGQARDGLKLLSRPDILVELCEGSIVYTSSTGVRQYAWSEINKLDETRDFVILRSGRLPLLMLPKSPFSAEALKFMKEKIEKGA